MVSVVMTVMGPDRPGLVDTLAGLIADNKGNWLDSRMSQLAGQFAGMLLVEVPKEQVEALSEALGRLSDRGLQTTFAVSDLVAGSDPQVADAVALSIEVVGQDRPGIVSRISSAIAGQGGNVEELRSELVDAPMTAEKLFRAVIRVSAPNGIDSDTLADQLEEIASDLMVDIQIG